MNCIEKPGTNDVLCGRGLAVMSHSGNEHFRCLVNTYRETCMLSSKREKNIYAKVIFDKITSSNPPGRFLKYDLNARLWYDIGYEQSIAKIKQALREGAPQFLSKLKRKTTGVQDQSHREKSSEVPFELMIDKVPISKKIGEYEKNVFYCNQAKACAVVIML